MPEMENLQLFDDQAIRTAWNKEEEERYFSVVDVVGALTDQPDVRRAAKYWSVLKTRIKKENGQLTTICSQLKLKAKDGKRYNTDVANTEQLLRIIQSIPSKKAEPFKLWLAQVGRERIEETLDPERIAERLVATYERKGYTREWINQRLQTIEMRKELTDEWKARGIEKEKDYAILTNEMTKAWSGLSVKEYKQFKNLKEIDIKNELNAINQQLNALNIKAEEIKENSDSNERNINIWT